MLNNAIAVANGKGGVGKTSLTANIGGLAAAHGWKVLLAELDPQGNLGADLGYADRDVDDGGWALYDAVVNGQPLVPLRNIRPNLDVVTGGPSTEQLDELLWERRRVGDPSPLSAVSDLLTSVGTSYDLVIIDCPPSASMLVDAGLAASHFLLIPTRGDAASLHGLARTARRFMAIRQDANPQLALLGVVLFDFGVSDKRLIAKARTQLEEALQGAAPVFRTFIRNSRKAPDDMRELGLLAHEYQRRAEDAPRWFEDPEASSYSTSATGLAGDYQNLTKEVLTVFSANLTRVAPADTPTTTG